VEGKPDRLQVNPSHLDIDGMVAPVINLGVDLAQRFDARLIGLSAADVPPPAVMERGGAFEGESMMRQRKNIERRIEDLRAEFEALAVATVDKEWRGLCTIRLAC
jgi:hypothetical protein